MAERKNPLPANSTYGSEKLTSADKAFLAAREAVQLKATDIVILDVRDAVALADYFVICTGDTKRHLRAIAARMEQIAREHDFEIHHSEGFGLAKWILLDLNNVVLHIFDGEARDYYELERLWGDAPRVPFTP